jgi:hypothetical protein
MQPNFEKMTNKELIAYALSHREEIEPLRVLYSRRTPDSEATWYGPMTDKDGVPIEENIRIAEAAIRQKIEQAKQKKEDNQS